MTACFTACVALFLCLTFTVWSLQAAPADAADVENILKEMKSGLPTPLTAIAATPRKECVDPKFTFDPAHAVAPLAGPRANPYSTVPLQALQATKVSELAVPGTPRITT